jgi:hypothetical protein
VHIFQAVNRLRQDARCGGLAGTAWTSKKVGVRYTVSRDCIAQGLYHVFLTYDLIPMDRAPFSIKRL